ncbi:MAG: hypothetical protein ABFS41_10830 [Myxococcota bacterium]
MNVLAVPESHRGWLWVGFCAVPAVMNGAINPAVAALQTRGQEVLSLWSTSGGLGPDTLGTSFFLPLITCLIVTPLVRRSVRRGAIGALPPVGGNTPRGLLRRGLRLGLLGVVGFGVPVVALLALLGVNEMERAPFLWWKAASTAFLGALVTPWIARLAVGDGPDAAASAQ